MMEATKDKILLFIPMYNCEKQIELNKKFVEINELSKVYFNDFRISVYGETFDNFKDKFIKNESASADKFSQDVSGLSFTDISEEIFNFEYEFEEPINGIENDYLYIDFNLENTMETDNPKLKLFNNRTNFNKDAIYNVVSVYFAGDGEKYTEYRKIGGYYSGNKLLIPTGANVNWLVSDIKKIKIEFTNIGEGSNLTINEADFYEHYPVEFDYENTYPMYEAINKIFK